MIVYLCVCVCVGAEHRCTMADHAPCTSAEANLMKPV